MEVELIRKGVQVIRDPDQYSTDLMKCLDVVDQRERVDRSVSLLLGMQASAEEVLENADMG